MHKLIDNHSTEYHLHSRRGERNVVQVRACAMQRFCRGTPPAVQAWGVKSGERQSTTRRQHSPEGGAKSDVAHEDDIQQNEWGGEEPVHVAGIVDAAQVAVWVCDINAATVSTLQGRHGRRLTIHRGQAMQDHHRGARQDPIWEKHVYSMSLRCAGRLI